MRCPPSGASRSSSRASSRRAPRRRRPAAQPAVGSRPRNLAAFTRQFAVMIDAGLPLVECLDLLGAEKPIAGLRAPSSRPGQTSSAAPSLADAMKKHPDVFDRALREHDRGRGGRRHPRHDPGPAGDLHREGREAEGPDHVGDDLSRRGSHNRHGRRRGDPVEGHPDVRRAVQRARRGAAAADAPRGRAQRRTRRAGCPGWSAGPLPAPPHSTVMPPRRQAAGSWTGAGSRCRCSDLSCGKSPSRGSAVRSGRSSGPASRFSTGWTSPPPPAATSSSRTPWSAHARSIERGETMAAPLQQTRVFPPIVVQMIGVGEATGALDTMLAKIADFYEDEADTAVAGLVALLEPLHGRLPRPGRRRDRHCHVPADVRSHRQAGALMCDRA